MIDTRGYEWKPYSISFDSPEGNFSFEIFAISHEHAVLQLASIKDSGKVDGEIAQILSD